MGDRLSMLATLMGSTDGQRSGSLYVREIVMELDIVVTHNVLVQAWPR